MQSFLLKIIFCVLIINITFCRSCFSPFCRAGCYLKQGGLDYGYCEDGQCKCSMPIIYVFDGIGRDLSDDCIRHSLDNDNLIQNSISVFNHDQGSESSSSDTLNINKNKMMLDSNNVSGHEANPKKMNPLVKDTTGSNNGKQKTIPIEMAQPKVTPSTPPEKLRNSNTREIMPKTDGSIKHNSRNTNGLGANGKANTNYNQKNHLDEDVGKKYQNKNDGLNPKSFPKPNNKQMVDEKEQNQDEILVEVSEETVEESDEDVSENQEISMPLKSSGKVPMETEKKVQVQKPEKVSSKSLPKNIKPRNINTEKDLPSIVEEDDDEWSGSGSESYSYEESQPVENELKKK